MSSGRPSRVLVAHNVSGLVALKLSSLIFLTLGGGDKRLQLHFVPVVVAARALASNDTRCGWRSPVKAHCRGRMGS